MSKTIIGLMGLKMSGKSTAAELIQKHIEGSLNIAIADKMKVVCSEVFNLDIDLFYNQDKKEILLENPVKLDTVSISCVLDQYNIYLSLREIDELIPVVNREMKTPRELVQTIGTDVLRQVGDEDLHCKYTKVLEEGTTIISDIRFDNEFNYFGNINNTKFVPIYIQRPMLNYKRDLHTSENSISDDVIARSYKLTNSGTIEEFEQDLLNILRFEKVI
jgi:hypothetical protein